MTTLKYYMDFCFNEADYVKFLKQKYGDKIKTTWSDRLYQWDSQKYNKCRKEIFNDESQYFNNLPLDDISKFLSLYIGYKVTVIAVYENVKPDGYSVWSIFYIE